jgi:enamine deaminase RidA (YjgF/YER057c/UK114 family)
MGITHLNPDTLYKNPAFSQAVVVSNPSKLIFIGGQDGVTTAGEIAGSDIASQTEQALKNVIAALEASGATLDDVVKLTLYMVQGQSLTKGFEVAQRFNIRPTAISVVFVAGLANPDYLIEIDAIAALS